MSKFKFEGALPSALFDWKVPYIELFLYLNDWFKPKFDYCWRKGEAGFVKEKEFLGHLVADSLCMDMDMRLL